jgi:CyaY protein
MAEQVSEADFERLAEEELDRLLEAIIAAGDELDPDLESGVLTIHFDDDTRYVVNSHRAARQIWMAAERAAWHFDYVPSKQKWIAAQRGDELWSAVSAVIGRKLGRAIDLSS